MQNICLTARVDDFWNQYGICLIFQDLGSGDLSSDLYIVAHVIRMGRMLFSESVKKLSSHNYRRPYGVALFRLAHSVLQGGEGEVSSRLSGCCIHQFTV